MSVHLITVASGWDFGGLMALLSLLPILGYSTSSLGGGGRSFSSGFQSTENKENNLQRQSDKNTSNSQEVGWKSREECARLELELVELERKVCIAEGRHQDALGELGRLNQKMRDVRARLAVLRGES